MRLAVVASHPIQYQAPIFRALAAEPGVDMRVYFGSLPDAAGQGEGFGVAFRWDVPLLEGYPFDVFAQGVVSTRSVAGLVAAAFRLRAMWRESRPDVVLLLGWHHPGMFPALAVAMGSQMSCILRCEATLLSSRGMAQRAWHRGILRRFAAFLPIGKANAAYYDAFGPKSTPRFFSPLCAGGQSMRIAAVDWKGRRKEARRGWGLDESVFCFLFAGKFMPEKRPDDIVRALSRIEESVVRVQALFVGAGEMARRLEELAGGLRSRVVFVGFLNQTEIPKAYAVADCVILPSESETWGLVVNEAMECGLPAIVSDRVGCAPDIVEPGETGMVFRCGDVEGLADCMRRMAADPAGAARMGARARERVAAYSVENAAGGILEAARAVTTRRGDGR